jgi:hypothetical protein
VNKNRFVAVGILVVCCMIVFNGCSTSKLVNIWSDSSFKSLPLNKILVISVSKNSAQRRLWEDAFSAELVKYRVSITSSYRLFPDAVPDTSQVIQAVQSNYFDGVLVIRRLPSEINPQYVNGYVTKEQDVRYNRRWNSFMTYYYDIRHDGYIDSQKVDIRAIDVWATKNEGQMIWSATSETPEPNSVQEVRPEIVKLVMTEMTQNGIIAIER